MPVTKLMDVTRECFFKLRSSICLEKVDVTIKSLSLNLTLAPADDGAGEIQQGEIIAGFLLPADQQTAKTINP